MQFASITDRLVGLGLDKWAVHLEGRRRAAEGADLIFLSIGEPDIAPPEAVLNTANDRMRAGRTKYSAGRGEPEVLNAIADYYTARSGEPVSTTQIVFSSGTQNALFASMLATVNPGDDVLVPDPYYATYESIVAAVGARFVPIATSPERAFHLDPADLERAITPTARALLLTTPSNPTGAVLQRDEIVAIAEICRRHNMWILCDEVYAELCLGDGIEFASPFDIPEYRDMSISVSSISKSHALPGFRCGWAAGSAETARRVGSITEVMMFGAQPFLADATAEALRSNAVTKEFRELVRARATALVKAFDGSTSSHTRMPEGGMFAMIDIRPTGLSGEAFAWRLLNEEGVVVMPGESFGARGAGHLRVAMTVDEQRVSEAARRIRALADRIIAEPQRRV